MADAASSSSGRCWKYGVFINFRGEDTRKIFVGHLYRALKQKAIHTFIDSEELRKGNDLSKLLHAIDDSRLSIVVLSKNYASSTWCLKELVKILECMDAQKQIVVPVFYEVDPSHVRMLEGNFAEAFAKQDDSNAEKEEVNSWKTALTRVANLCGWDSRDYKDDGELIEKIVKDTLHKLLHVSSSKAQGLVGMDYHLNTMYSLLSLGVDDVRFVGIWGMGGIGKTTIAHAVYDEIACLFDHCCFLDDVKEKFKNKGKAQIENYLLSRILKEKVTSTCILSRGSNMIMEWLGKKKVLLVLDDLDDIAQIETLLWQHSFGGGSRIILTTRYKHSLSGVGYRLYEPKCLSYDTAHELFMKYAFRTNKSSVEYDHLIMRAIEYAQGLPLALKVLGASLYNRSVPAWEDTLEKIKETPQREIQDALRRSFDGLDPSEKNIFLDIACFFRGKNRIYVTNFLNICGFFPKIGLEVLVDKALVTIGDDDTIEMHDLLVEMGQKIGSASRLWSYQDISRVLTENTGTEAVEAIILDLSPPSLEEIYWNIEALGSMKKLRLLMVDVNDWCKQQVSGDLKFLSHQLRLLHWRGCPLKSLPSNFQPLNLVRLSMPCSHIEQLWEGTKPLGNLKYINFSGSPYLRKIPDCSQATNLETLDLNGCTSLLEVHSSIFVLEQLVFFSLQNCTVLKTLSSSIHMESLKTLILSGCSNLAKFPKISGIMEELAELRLDDTAIVELPSSINNLPGLVNLSLKGCTKFKRLPSSICQLKSLKYLILSGCSKFEVFPIIEEDMEELRELHLDGTSIKELSPSVERLKRLMFLNMRNCRSLVRLPDYLMYEPNHPFWLLLPFESEMTCYLYPKSKEMLEKTDLEHLFFSCIKNGVYDLALRLLNTDRALAKARTDRPKNKTALHILAQRPSEFGCQRPGIWGRLINSFLPCFKFAFKRKLNQAEEALQLVQRLWEEILKDEHDDVMRLIKYPSNLLFDAAEFGNYEFLAALLSSYPELVWETDEKNRTIIHVAVLHRHASIFNLVHEIGSIKDIIVTSQDDEGNNIVHIYGCKIST